ncbi:MAG: GAF domain-containing sensor histidine kinase [Elusimicrobiales bacterium]|nr:GAF domain-containing sensor histidine kinase [Elusimicrobiales bacterium]
MHDLLASVILGAVLAFTAWWYLKFRYLLPAERRLKRAEKELSGFAEFARESLEHSSVPDSQEHYFDIAEYYFIKLHAVFAGGALAAFERSGGGWRMAGLYSDQRSDQSAGAVFAWEALDRCVNEGEFLFQAPLEPPPPGDLFAGMGAAVLCPFMPSHGGYRRVVVFAHPSPRKVEESLPYFRFLMPYLNSVWRMAEKNFSLKKETEQLKGELSAVLQELDAAGSRLIQRAKERKALYEVVTKATGVEKDMSLGCSAVLNIVAKIAEADVAAVLLYDDSRNELVAHPGSYGIPDDDRLLYSIPITNTSSASVRAFVNREPFMSPDAQNDPDVIGHHAKLWNIRSLMIVPIVLGERVIGVLRVGSLKPDFFTPDQLEFLTIIADELAMIIEMTTLYENATRTAQELAQLNNLKDEFLATVSHELKTPLTTIKGFVSVILSGEVGSLNEQQTNFLSVVDQSANRLTHLISNLLDFSRLNGKVEMEFQPVNIRELVSHSISNMLLKAREKEIEIESRFAGKLPDVYADSRWITQVIDNLLINAIKFSRRGCTVKVTGQDKGEAVVISVEDDGPGIPEEEKKLVFEKFYRGKNSVNQVPGTGLGLAISRSVIEKHGGRIWLEAPSGNGARFNFALPIHKVKVQP